MVRGFEGPELGQIPQDVDESREDVSDAERSSRGLFGVCEEDEGWLQAVPNVARHKEQIIITHGGARRR